MSKMKIWSIQCIACLRILGISINYLPRNEIYCMKCAKKELNKKDANLRENEI